MTCDTLDRRALEAGVLREKETRRSARLLAVALSLLVHALVVLLLASLPAGEARDVWKVAPTPPAEHRTITFNVPFKAESATRDPEKSAPFRPIEPQPTPKRGPEAGPSPPPGPPAGAEAPPAAAARVPEPAPAVETSSEAGEERPEPEEAGTQPVPAPGARPGPGIDLQQAMREVGRLRTDASGPAPRQAPGAAAVPEGGAGQEPGSIPATGFGVGNLEFESRDFDWSDYGRQIYMAIWRAWHNRLWLTTDEFEKWAYRTGNWRLDHSTRVRFVIERSGQVTGIEQESGSGCAPLDQSALDALAEVVLPPLPASFPRQAEVVHARFIAEGPVRAMSPMLGRYKKMGLF